MKRICKWVADGATVAVAYGYGKIRPGLVVLAGEDAVAELEVRIMLREIQRLTRNRVRFDLDEEPRS